MVPDNSRYEPVLCSYKLLEACETWSRQHTAAEHWIRLAVFGTLMKLQCPRNKFSARELIENLKNGNHLKLHNFKPCDKSINFRSDVLLLIILLSVCIPGLNQTTHFPCYHDSRIYIRLCFSCYCCFHSSTISGPHIQNELI